MMESNSSDESDEWISDHEWSDVSVQTRRRLLQKSLGGLAAGGIASIAGCSGDGDETDTPTEANGGGETTEETGNTQYVDDTLDHIISISPDNAAFNPYGQSSNWSFRWYWALFDQWAVHDKNTNKTKGMILDSWEYNDDGTVTFTIRDTYTWSNGDDLNAEDAVTQLKLGQLMQTVNKGYGAAPAYENVRATGDYELQFDLKNPNISRDIFEFGHLKRRGWFWANRNVWGEFAEKFDDATTESELESVRAEVQQTTKSPVWDSSQVPTNSIWNFEGGDANKANMTARDDYYSPFSETDWASGDITGDQIDYDLRWRRYPNQQQRTQAMKKEIIDVSYPPESESARKEIRELGWRPSKNLTEEQIVPTMRSAANGLFFNCQSPITGDRRVRKAIMHVTPRKPMMTWHADYGNYWTHDKHVTGIGQDKEVPWFGGLENWPDSDLQGFEQYANQQSDVDTERATQLLEDAGFSKSGGRWKDPDGNNVTLRAYVPTTSEEPMGLKYTQIAKGFLDDFGLNTQVTAQEESVRTGTTMETGDFEMMFDVWGGAKSAPPSLDWDVSLGARLTETIDGQTISGNSEWGMSPKVEVPYPIGDPDGDLKEVDINAKRQKLQQSMSDEERKKLVNEVAWIFNQTVPMMTVNEEGGAGGYWINTSHWKTYPPEGGKNPAYRYEIIEIGQYSYAQYMAKMGTEWFHQIEK